MSKQSPYAILRQKSVFEILQGDTPLTSEGSNQLCMPYLSGPKIIEMSNRFGMECEYQFGGGPSRWQLMQNLFDFCEDHGRTSDLLAYLFSKEHFAGAYPGRNAAECKKLYELICTSALKRINGVLFFGGNELREVAGRFVVSTIDESPQIDAPIIKAIDRKYISDLAKRADADIENDSFDSALTKARTLLEEVFCYVIEVKNEIPSDKGDINKLYKQVKDIYNMHATKEMDIRFKTLLSGLEKVVTAVSEMRNKNSDAHGVGLKRVAICDYHARLMVNSSIAMGEFILSVANNANS